MNKISILSLALVMSVGLAFADTTINGGIDIPVLSSFNSRGRVFQDETVTQPSVTVNVPTTNGTFLLNVWGNMSPNNYNSTGDSTFNEVDIIVEYLGSLNKINYGIGIIEYIYSGTFIPNTHEAYVRLEYATFLNPNVLVYYDFKEANSAYVFAGVSHSVNIYNAITATVDTGIGWASDGYNKLYFGFEDKAFNDWSSGLTVNLAVNQNLDIYAGVQRSELIDSEIDDGADFIYGDSDKTVGQVGAIILF